MKPRNYREYIQGTITFGVAYAVVSLLARWVTGNTILSSPETLVKYGLLGGIGYAMMGAIALFLFGCITPYIRERFPNSLTLGDVLKERLRGRSYWFVMWVLLLTSLDSLLIQALGAGVLFHFLLKTPIYVGLLVFFLYCFLLSIGGMKQIHRFEGIHISFIFAAIILIPVYFFIQKGIFPVYDGLLLYHPYLLFLKHNEITLFILTAFLIGFGQVLIDRASWQRIYIIEKSKVRTSFMMAGIIWATIPLAFTAIVLIAVYGQGFENIYSILSQLVEKIDSLFLLLLFIGCCFSAIASTVGAELHATSIMVIRNMLKHTYDWSEDQQLKKTYLVSGVLSLSLFLISSVLSPNLMELIFFFAQVYASIIPTMLVVIFYKRMIPMLVPYCSLIGLGTGLLSLLNYNSIQSTWISFFVSSGLVVILLVVNEIRIHRK
jgi:Na+/proline symporter